MGRWCAYLSGLLLIAVALVALPSGMIVESYAGGSAVHGSVEDGRYFVNPGHGWPVVEVPESTWRTVYWLELLWPLSVVPGLIGGVLMMSGMGPNWKPAPVPPGHPPLGITAVGAGIMMGLVAAGARLGWLAGRATWVAEVGGCLGLYVGGGLCVSLMVRHWRRQSSAQPGAAPAPRECNR
jgi:hypothetical protein